MFLPNGPTVLQQFFNKAILDVIAAVSLFFLILLLLLITQLPLLSLFFSPPLLLSPLLFHFLDSVSLSRPQTRLAQRPSRPRQARMELRRLKQEARNKHAVTVIWAYWQGTKVFQPLSPGSVSLSQLSCHPCPPCPVPSHSHYDTA